MLKILSWNIQAGGGSRLLRVIKKIKDSKADIITLSEFRNNGSGIILRNALLKAGYRYQAVTASKPNENSVIIVSNLPFSSKIFPFSDPVYHGNMVAAKFSAFQFIGVYMPHKKKHKLFESVVEEISQSEEPLIIAGDYNTGKNYIDQKGNSFWYTDELKKMEEAGMTDAFRFVNGEEKAYSWYSHQNNGFRYDHIYVDHTLEAIIRNCYYDHSWREEQCSDHSPMFLELG